MKPGETLETAIWLDGTETPEQRKRFEDDLKAALASVQDEHGVIVGPVIWTEKKPGEDRMPDVPDHIQGPDVRLLVAEAQVICAMPDIGPLHFAEDLEPDDRARLRKITRKAYARFMPHIMSPLTDRQCDRLINDLGPEAALEALRQGEANLSGVLH